MPSTASSTHEPQPTKTAPEPASGTADGPTRGGGPIAIVAATALMALQDAVIKLLSGDLPLWQLFLLRSIVVLPILFAVVARRDPNGLREAAAPWILIRSCLIVAMYVAFYAAVPVLEFSVVSAVYHTAPLFIVAFSALMLNERVNATQVFGVILAFTGVLVVVRPTGDAFSWATLLPLAAALFYALSAVATRGKTSRANPWTLMLSLNLVFTVVGALGMGTTALVGRDEAYPFLSTPWAALTAPTIAIVLTLAAISIGIHLLLAKAYQLGPTPVVAALDFTYLAFAPVWGYLFFSEVPDWPTIVGTLLIAAGGAWSLRKPHSGTLSPNR